jgi:hemerythrin superfamily protein
MKILAEGDVVDVLLDQHDQIRRSLEEVATAVGEAKAVAFLEVETNLYVHETGEQQVVHPVMRDVAGESGLVDGLVAEEQDADRLLGRLRDLDVNHPDFDTLFARLRDTVTAHLQAEEGEEFPRLRTAVDAGRLLSLADQLRSAQEIP